MMMMKRVLVIDLTLEDENERSSTSKKRSRPIAVCHVAVEKKVCKENEEEQDEALVEQLLWELRYAQEQAQEPVSSSSSSQLSTLSAAGSCSTWALNMYVPNLELSSNKGGDVFVAHKKRVLQELDALLCW